MASPFPGMDPYLEEPARWGGVHTRLMAVLGEMLTRQVTPRFFVDSEDSVYVLAPDDPARPLVRPDIFLADTEAEVAAAPRRQSSRTTASLVIDLPQPITVRYPSLIVHDTRDRWVVAVLTLLSPVNKTPGSAGRRRFLRKRRRWLGSRAHWLEIDLLRAGERPDEVAGRGDYYAALHRADGEGTLEVWFSNLRDELPVIAVPLVAPLPDAALDLQAAVETVYERYGYDTGIDYAADPPPPPLSADDAAWASRCIQHWR